MTEELEPVFEDWDSRVMEIERLLVETEEKYMEYRHCMEKYMTQVGAYKRVLAILRREDSVDPE